MKKLNLLAAFLGCSLLLAGCDTTKDKFKPITDSTDVTDIDDIIVTPDDEDESEIVHKTCTEVTHGSISASLTDFSVGRYAEVGCKYTCAFTPSTTLDKTYTVTTDEPIIGYASIIGTGTFLFEAISQGDVILRAYDSTQSLVLQMVIQVRNRISADKIANKMFNVDYFAGMFYGYTLSFVSGNPLVGYMIGQDDVESTVLYFECRNREVEMMYEFNYYKYDMQLDMDRSSTMRTYTGIYISVTGDEIMIYYSDGLIDMFRAVGN